MFPYIHAVSCAFLIGIWIGEVWVRQLDPNGAYISIWWWIAGENILLFILFRLLKGNINVIFLLAASLCLGITRLAIENEQANSDPLIPFRTKHISLIGKVQGRVSSPCSFPLQVTNIVINSKVHPIKSTLLIRSKDETVCNNINEGYTIQIRGILLAPKEKRNPGELSQRIFLLKDRLYHILWAREPPYILDSNPPPFPYNLIAKTRFQINHFATALTPFPFNSLLLGITIGQQSSIPQNIKDEFQYSGTTHLLVASGSNVSIVMSIVLTFLFLATRSRAPSLWKIFIAAIAVILYALLVGAEPSIWRASIMALIAFTALLTNSEKESLIALFVSGIILTANQPFVLFDLSFQLSFLSVLGIVLLSPRIMAILKPFPSWLTLPIAITLAAQLAITPVAIYYFQRLSLIAPIANLIAVPLATVILVATVITFFVSLIAWPIAQGLSFWTNAALWCMQKWISLCANLPGASLQTQAPTPWFFLIYYFLLLLWISWPNISAKAKISAACLILSLILLKIIFYQPPDFQTVFLDVGQGDAAVVFLHNKAITLLIDGGRANSSRYLIRFLQREGVKKIDYLILTHPHLDHLEGLLPVLDSFKVRRILQPDIPSLSLQYKTFLRKAATNNIPISYIHSKDKIFISPKSVLHILWPPKSLLTNTSSPINNNSLVMKLYYKDVTILFSGDIEKEAETLVWKEYRHNIRATILKVPHHGSIKGSLPPFIAATRPKISVISVGELNSYGHPHPATLATLERLSNQLYRTDQNGALVVESNGKEVWCRPMTGPTYYQ